MVDRSVVEPERWHRARLPAQLPEHPQQLAHQEQVLQQGLQQGHLPAARLPVADQVRQPLRREALSLP